MKRTWWIALAAIGFAQLGCGGKSDSGTADAGGATGQPLNPIAEAKSAPVPPPAGGPAPGVTDVMVPLSSLNLANPTKPEEVVGAFLDGMRTGNAKVIEGLLSTRARQEIADKGLDIAPIGSPQARFEIGVAQLADPKDPNTMLVSSNWLEPGNNGQAAGAYEVVWALIKETDGWRICEMAVDTHQEGEEIQVVNFENLADMVPASNPPARTAANPNTPVGTPPPLPTAPPALPASNVPPVSSAPGSTLPALPNAAGNGAGSLPPLPPSGFGGGSGDR